MYAITKASWAASCALSGSHSTEFAVMIDSLKTHAEMSRNWEAFPEFGHYEGLSNFDRAIPAMIEAAQAGL